MPLLQTFKEQVCIPVGCVPPVALTGEVGGGGSVLGPTYPLPRRKNDFVCGGNDLYHPVVHPILYTFT